MASTSHSGRGLLCIAGAIGLGILSILLQYVWSIFLPASGLGDTGSFYHTVHSVLIPLSGLVLSGAGAALFVIGFLLAWRDRATPTRDGVRSSGSRRWPSLSPQEQLRSSRFWALRPDWCTPPTSNCAMGFSMSAFRSRSA